MIDRERQLQAVLAQHHQLPFDGFSLVTAVVATAVLAVAAIPAFGRGPGVVPIVLTVFVIAFSVLATVQWLALMIRFGFRPPILVSLAGVTAVLVAAAMQGQRGALVALGATLVATYVWRIASETETRFGDVAIAVAAVAVIGYLPAYVLLLRRLPFGIEGFYLWLVPVFAFMSVQAVLSRPASDGTRHADVATAAAALVCTAVSAVLGWILGDPFGLGPGLLVGAATAAGGVFGQMTLEILAPAPATEGRRIRRRPLLFDALAPLFVSVPFAFFAVRHILT